MVQQNHIIIRNYVKTDVLIISMIEQKLIGNLIKTIFEAGITTDSKIFVKYYVNRESLMYR